jgi:subtilase family serine protease
MFIRLACAALAAFIVTMTAAASASEQSTTVQNHEQLRDLGRAGAGTRVDVAVVLQYHHAEQLDGLLNAQGDASSPLYHRFLTPAQFELYFAPTPAEYEYAIAQLRGAGFVVTNISDNRTIVDAAAPAPLVERYFATELHLVRRGDGTVRYFNVRRYSIPQTLAGIVSTVVGLDSAHALRPQYVRLPNRPMRLRLVSARTRGAPLFGPDGGYGPRVFRMTYGFPGGMTGQGRASGVATDADFLATDLAAYLRYFGVTRTGPTYRIFVDGGPPRRILIADSVETTLDVETLVSLAPGTAMYVYETAPQAESLNFVDMYNKVVTDNKVDTLNTSFSQCETLDPAFTAATETIEQQGSALGITFHSSTGDVGSLTFGCGLNVTVAVPASTPHNVAVGGTFEEVDRVTGLETSETGWNDASGTTGGGVSTVFGLPAYQRSVGHVIASGRNIPDISFDASAYTGESLFFDYNFNGPVGGTSVSSPLFGAGLAAINQMKSSRQGFFNPTLYKTWQRYGYIKGTSTFIRDMTSGSIPPIYYARQGYDQVTGIGAIQFDNFGAILP